MAPLHLRPGDDLRERLPRAGIAGEYLCFADPVCVGPVEDSGDLGAWLDRRARFVAGHSGSDPLAVRLRLGRESAALLEAAANPRHAALWLWFEHDLWDQAALIRVLPLLRGATELRLVPADGARCFPELADAELAALRPVPLSAAQQEEAAAAWAAFAAPDPRGLDALSRRDLALPFLGAALRRHLRDLPWRSDGLAETERRVLCLLRDGVTGEGALLRALRAADPVFHLTDLILREVLRRLRSGPLPLATGRGVTEHGLAVLAGRQRHRPVQARHQGGVRVLPDPPWFWDPEREGVVAGSA